MAAFQRTLLASVTLIMVSTLMTAMVLSLCCLRIRYFWNHYLALLVCTLGVFATVYQDLHDEQGRWDFGNGLGDLLALVSSLSQGVTATINDHLLRTGSNNVALLAHIGAFGCAFSFIVFLCLQ